MVMNGEGMLRGWQLMVCTIDMLLWAFRRLSTYFGRIGIHLEATSRSNKDVCSKSGQIYLLKKVIVEGYVIG